MWAFSLPLVLIVLSACHAPAPITGEASTSPFVVVLGVAQDAGYPQSGCERTCCRAAWDDAGRRRNVACLAIVDPVSRERWMIDATPDFREQLRTLDDIAPPRSTPDLSGILLTHAHIGHYTGLMMLGHESIGARSVPVHAMPRMRAFLESNGPWDQLVRFENIELRELAEGVPVELNERLRVTPFRVPHRDEYSEVVGFRIEGPSRTVVYIPDIDKWERWDQRIEDVIAAADIAYLDGTFHADGEIPHRDMSQIPHPFIVETMQRLGPLDPAERAKVRFIHLNHTNPVLDPGSEARLAIRAAGFHVAREGERQGL